MRVPKESWKVLALPDSPGAEVQKQDLSVNASSIFNDCGQGVRFLVAKDGPSEDLGYAEGLLDNYRNDIQI